jgi:putative addiction module killer protein
MNNLITQTSIFEEWLDKQDFTIQVRIVKAIDKARLGNFGDHKCVGCGVYEMRLHFGSGYRVYYAQEGECVYLLISAGR